MNTMNLLPAERDAVAEIRALVNRFTEGWEKLDSGQVLSTITRRDDIVVFGTVSTAEQNGTAVAVQKGTTWRLWACPRSP